MKLRILPKCFVENDKSILKNKVLISIIGGIEIGLPIENLNRYKDFLELRFDDIKFDVNKIEKYKDFKGMIPFNLEHYKEIEKFEELYDDIDIDIHCSAGVSRSSAVALGICMIKNDLELMKDTILNHKNISPNELILSHFRIYANPFETGISIKNIYYYINKNKENGNDFPEEYVHKNINI